MPSFLDLPVEVRLQIYKNIIKDHPITHPHLATQSVIEAERQQYMQPIGRSHPRSTVIQRQPLTVYDWHFRTNTMLISAINASA